MEKINGENFVELAEKAMRDLGKIVDKKGRAQIVSTSKLRNILAMTADLYNEVRLSRSEELDESLRQRLSYLRVRCLYEAGRENTVKDFITKSDILKIMTSIKTRADYILFSQYMEALVAWRKFLYEDKEG